MNKHDLTVWAAGCIEGCGVVACTIQQGPTRMYHAIDLLAVTGDSEAIARLIDAAGNGDAVIDEYGPQRFVLGGYAAIRGFLEDLWPYLTPHKRHEFNMELKRFKMLKQGDIAR